MSPFQSARQLRFMAARKPKIFKRWKKKYGVPSKVREQLKKKKTSSRFYGAKKGAGKGKGMPGGGRRNKNTKGCSTGPGYGQGGGRGKGRGRK